MKLSRLYWIGLAVLLIAGDPTACMAGSSPGDTTNNKQPRENPSVIGKRNVLTYNITTPLIFGFDNVVLGYERVLKPNQSIVFTVGYRHFPKLAKNKPDQPQFVDRENLPGFSFTGEYRFYFLSRNRRTAPDGLFGAAFISGYNAGFRNTVKFDDGVSEARLDTRISLYAIGASLGYQFLLWDRVTLDLTLVGPSFGIYNFRSKLDGNIKPGENEMIWEELVELMTEAFPGLKTLLTEKEVENTDSLGSLDSFSPGFQYMARIGYVF